METVGFLSMLQAEKNVITINFFNTKSFSVTVKSKTLSS